MTDGAYTTVGPRRPPGPFNWNCTPCSSKEPYKSNKYPGCWNGAQAMVCRGCAKAPTSRSCNRYGTNGKNGGKWKPWDADNPPTPPAKPATPSPTTRTPAASKNLEKRLAEAEKRAT